MGAEGPLALRLSVPKLNKIHQAMRLWPANTIVRWHQSVQEISRSVNDLFKRLQARVNGQLVESCKPSRCLLGCFGIARLRSGHLIARTIRSPSAESWKLPHEATR